MNIKARIDLIIESPRLGFWRICGKEAQIKYRHANKNATDEERVKLLKEIMDMYVGCIDNMGCIKSRERRTKKSRIMNYAGGIDDEK